MPLRPIFPGVFRLAGPLHLGDCAGWGALGEAGPFPLFRGKTYLPFTVLTIDKRMVRGRSGPHIVVQGHQLQNLSAPQTETLYPRTGPPLPSPGECFLPVSLTLQVPPRSGSDSGCPFVSVIVACVRVAFLEMCLSAAGSPSLRRWTLGLLPPWGAVANRTSGNAGGYSHLQNASGFDPDWGVAGPGGGSK